MSLLSARRKYRDHNQAMLLTGMSLTALLCLVICGCIPRSQQRVDGSETRVVQLTDQNFEELVLESDQPVLVDMWAAWCQPCVDFKPALHAAAQALHGHIVVAELNVQENRFTNEKYEIDQLPTIMVFVNGEVVERVVGSRSKSDLLELVKPYRQGEKG